MRFGLMLLGLLVLVTGPVLAQRSLQVSERRTALVIGNASYQIGPLKNPLNDANDMARLLKTSGFAVTLLTDADQRKMEQAIRDFGKHLQQGGVGLFYYAGHGMQVKGINYLIPIGANIGMEEEIKFEAVDANRVLAMMETAGNRLNMMFLDACRDNPFSRSFRSSSQGLAQMDAPRGTLVAFATAPGKTAADGKGRNGLFTGHLLKQMSQSTIELDQLMKNITKGVIDASGGKQTPWRLSSTTGDFYFNGGSISSVEAPKLAGGSFQSEAFGQGNLKITSDPQPAEIYIDDTFSGNSPLKIKLKPGIYTIEARKEGYKKESKRIRLFEDTDLELSLILDRAGTSLFITSQPPGAQVYIDQAFSGATPLELKATMLAVSILNNESDS